VVEPTVHTTQPKVGTTSTEVPTAQALVARLGSKVLDGNLADDDPGLLNFAVVEFEIVCRTSSWL
jgi:hypothetical protein